MQYLEKLLWFFPKSNIERQLTSKETRKDFFLETDYLNFQRLRILSYIIVFIITILLILNLNSKGLLKQETINKFLLLDLFLLSYYFLLAFYLSFFFPKEFSKITFFHKVLLRFTVLCSIIWSAFVTIVETQSGISATTFIIVVFAILTIFIFRTWFTLAFLASGILALYLSLLFSGFSVAEIYSSHQSSITLSILAFTISRLLYSTYIKAYSASLEKELTNKNLDNLIKNRTQQLEDSNQKLMQEILARKQYEKQLRKEIRRAEEADKLKASFLANMSHEIRTPLNGIIGFADLLNTPNLEEEKKVKYISIVHRNSDKLLKIIEDIMDISMLESNQMKMNMEWVKVNYIYESIIESYKTYISKKNIKNIKFLHELWTYDNNVEILTDFLRINQIMNNIIKNAFKFTKLGYVKVVFKVSEEEVFIIVEDTGIGIEPTKTKVIFESFAQAETALSKNFGGTGLGLSISKGLVLKMGGNLWFDQSFIGGARFCITLPLNTGLSTSTNKPIQPHKIKFNNKKILIYSSPQEYLLLLKDFFLEYSPELHIASNIRELHKILSSTNIDAFIVVHSDNELQKTFMAVKQKYLLKVPVFLIVDSDLNQKSISYISPLHQYKTPLNLTHLIRDIYTTL